MVAFKQPGIYIDEFTPAPPIQGAGTSTVAMIGTALRGPVNRAVRLSDWPAFRARFGDVTGERPPSGPTLPRSAYGFFRNGGRDLIVIRAAEATHASKVLQSHTVAGAAAPALRVEARIEGNPESPIVITTEDSSVLADVLGVPRIPVHRAVAPVQQISGDRLTVTVDGSPEPFQVGESVVFVDTTAVPDTTSDPRTVAAVPDATHVKLTSGAPPGTFDRIRSADLRTGQREIRLSAAAGARLDLALPAGTRVAIGWLWQGGVTDYRTVESTTSAGPASTLTLSEALTQPLLMDQNAPAVESLEFTLTVEQGDIPPEEFARLSMGPGSPNYWARNVDSALVEISEPTPPPAHPPPDPRPRPTSGPLDPGQEDNRRVAWDQLVADPEPQLSLLEREDEVDLVCIPGATGSVVQQALLQHCTDMHDRFAILDSQPGADIDGVIDQIADVRSERGYAALYFPWLQVVNPASGLLELWPPSGHVAGIYARTDNADGVHTAPANASVVGATGLERTVTDDEQGRLNDQNVNALRVFRGQSAPLVWGARTTVPGLGRGNAYLQYVPIRRLLLFIENSIEDSIRWAVFRPNETELWGQLNRVISDFLTRVWRDGALFGRRPDQAFYVLIDETNNPRAEQVLGRLHIEVGLRPAYPAEFIVVRIGISEFGADVQEG